MLLKKYTVRELRSAEEDARRGFSFFVAAGGMALPVGQEQLPTVFNNASVIHGFLSVPFPLPVSCKVRHEDFQGVIRFDLTFEVSFSLTPELGNFMILNAEKEAWSAEELGERISQELKNRLAPWFSERIADSDPEDLEKIRFGSFFTEGDKNALSEMLPGFLRGSLKDLGVRLLGGAEFDAFTDKAQELMDWAAAQGIKPLVVSQILEGSPSLDIARKKLTDILNTGKASAYDDDAAALLQWAEKNGIRRDDAREVIRKAETLQRARQMLEEKIKGGNDYDTALNELKAWARSKGFKEDDINGIIADNVTLASARSAFEARLLYQERLEKLLTGIVAECGLPREIASQKLAKARGDLRKLEEIGNEIFESHPKALEFKEKFDFDSIVAVYDEFEKSGGYKSAFRIWACARKLREVHHGYARRSLAECVEFTRKNSPEVVEKIIEDYMKNRNGRAARRFFIFLLICVLAAGSAWWYFSQRSTFELEILSGNGAALESVVFNSFGRNFKYSSNTFRIISSSSAKLRFIEELKRNGHTVTAVSPEKYSVFLAAPDKKSKENWKVDSSAFLNDTQTLALFRKYLGNSVNGGSADTAVVSREELTRMQQELDRAGFLVHAANGVITLKVKTYTFRIRTADETAAPVAEILRRFNITAAGEITLTDKVYKSLLKSFKNDPRLGKVELMGRIIMVHAPAMQLYSVAVQLNSAAEYGRLLKLLAAEKKLRVNEKKLINHADIVTIAELKITSQARSAAEVQELVCSALYGKLNGFKERNVKVKR